MLTALFYNYLVIRSYHHLTEVYIFAVFKHNVFKTVTVLCAVTRGDFPSVVAQEFTVFEDDILAECSLVVYGFKAYPETAINKSAISKGYLCSCTEGAVKITVYKL